MYHAVISPKSVVGIDPEIFQFQMEWLAANGFTTISLTEVKETLETRATFPKKTIALTFDDGYESLYHNAWPVLTSLSFKATIFLVTGHCGRYNDWDNFSSAVPKMRMLGWEQIREMSEFGIEFGSHSVSHPRLDRLELTAIKAEVTESKLQIEQQLNLPVKAFAYPYGWYDERVKGIVRSNYEVACSTGIGLVSASSDPFELERADVYYLQAKSIFKMLSNEKLFPNYLAVRKKFHQVGSSLLHRSWR